MENEDFSFGEKIKALGWDFYCMLKETTYVDLVREFYQNFLYTDNRDKLVIKGVKILMDASYLGHILHLPYEGSSSYELTKREDG